MNTLLEEIKKLKRQRDELLEALKEVVDADTEGHMIPNWLARSARAAIDDVARFIKDQLGTNPLAERAAEYARGIEFRVGQLAERDARIDELERELAEARKDAGRWKHARNDPRVVAIYCGSAMAPGHLVDEAIDRGSAGYDTAMLAEREKG